MNDQSKDLSSGIETVAADQRLNVSERLDEMRKWQAEARERKSQLLAWQLELDMSRLLDRQQAFQIQSMSWRLDVLSLRKPLEISPQAVLDAGGFAQLRGVFMGQFAKLSRNDRLLWLDNLQFVFTPDLRALDDKVTRVRRYRAMGQQRNFLLGAPSGMGKSTYGNYLTATNLPVIQEERNVVPVIKFDAPVSNLTSKALLQRLISECGGTYSKGDTEEDLLMRLVIYIARCEVELIIIDEVEHISSHQLKRRLLEISNLTHHVPIICASCEPHKWARGDVEIAGRWNDYFSLVPYKGERLIELLTFLELLLPFPQDSGLDRKYIGTTSVEKKGATRNTQDANPVAIKPSPGDGPARLIELWTGGIMREIMVLIRDASQQAILRGLPCLTVDLLAETWGNIRRKSLNDAQAAARKQMGA